MFDDDLDGLPNLPLPTMGGRQFWADVFVYGGWRIQQNVLTRHYRLLDTRDVRQCFGSYSRCRRGFEKARRRGGIARRRHLVLLVHGLGCAKGSMALLERALDEDGYEATGINYPSTRRSLDKHAAQIRLLLDSLEDVDAVSFVTHSLGGLVLRVALSGDAAWRCRVALGRAVMLAPPSRGATLADEVQGFAPYHLVFGAVSREVTPAAVARLPAPPLEFGIIAGGRGNDEGYNPLLDGDDDGVVRVSETQLDGAADFLLVDSLHHVIMDHPTVVAATRSFLQTGRFAP